MAKLRLREGKWSKRGEESLWALAWSPGHRLLDRFSLFSSLEASLARCCPAFPSALWSYFCCRVLGQAVPGAWVTDLLQFYTLIGRLRKPGGPLLEPSAKCRTQAPVSALQQREEFSLVQIIASSSVQGPLCTRESSTILLWKCLMVTKFSDPQIQRYEDN